MKHKTTAVKALKCENCGDTIYSRATHDFHHCSCKDIAIDGGFDYLRISFTPTAKYSHKQLRIKASREELYDDWNMKTDKFGRIKGKK